MMFFFNLRSNVYNSSCLNTFLSLFLLAVLYSIIRMKPQFFTLYSVPPVYKHYVNYFLKAIRTWFSILNFNRFKLWASLCLFSSITVIAIQKSTFFDKDLSIGRCSILGRSMQVGEVCYPLRLNQLPRSVICQHMWYSTI